METKQLYGELRRMGLSPAYSSQISRGNRPPSLPLAIEIYRKVGLKLGPISEATEAEIDALDSNEAKNVSKRTVNG